MRRRRCKVVSTWYTPTQPLYFYQDSVEFAGTYPRRATGEKNFQRPTVNFHLPLLPVKISENWHVSARARAACSIAGKALRATPRALPLTKNTQLHTSDRLQPPQMPPKSPAVPAVELPRRALRAPLLRSHRRSAL